MEGGLISRSALLENALWFVDDYGDLKDFPYIDVEDVHNAPAVDAVEVVRCKDCKWYKNYGRTSLLVGNRNVKAGWCQRRIRYEEDYRMLPDDFCSYGERREAND